MVCLRWFRLEGSGRGGIGKGTERREMNRKCGESRHSGKRVLLAGEESNGGMSEEGMEGVPGALHSPTCACVLKREKRPLIASAPPEHQQDFPPLPQNCRKRKRRKRKC